ncbi:DUF1559 domain-containing protein [Gimesia sp.]|uniref:DUF1559 family PulG-like putative transporter n=1 Tax=Gimesia sp. TaxID=2024833 RepID=UPI003A941773
MANWYVKRGSQVAGPLTRERLNQLAAEGKVQKTDLVREGEDGEFHPAAKVSDLFTGAETSAWDEFDSRPETQPQSSQPATKNNKMTLIIILAVVGVGGLFVVGILLALLLPAVEQARIAARRSQSKNNLKQIGLAMHNYHETHRILPPGGTLTIDGAPSQSWTTFIIPFMDEAPLYNQIDFDYAWDHPSNQSIFRKEMPFFLNPNFEEKVSPEGLPLSHYVGNELMMGPNRGSSFRNVTDGLANTIMAYEVGDNFKPWGDPTNFAVPADRIGSGKKSAFPGGNHILMGDGRVRFLSENIDPAVLKALSTPNGGERIDEF